MVGEPLWTTRQTAKFLNLSEQTLCNWRWRGGIGPSHLRMNGAIRYAPETVREWLAGQVRVSTSDRGPQQVGEAGR